MVSALSQHSFTMDCIFDIGSENTISFSASQMQYMITNEKMYTRVSLSVVKHHFTAIRTIVSNTTRTTNATMYSHPLSNCIIGISGGGGGGGMGKNPGIRKETIPTKND